jgi:hypothetical protein
MPLEPEEDAPLDKQQSTQVGYPSVNDDAAIEASRAAKATEEPPVEEPPVGDKETIVKDTPAAVEVQREDAEVLAEVPVETATPTEPASKMMEIGKEQEPSPPAKRPGTEEEELDRWLEEEQGVDKRGHVIPFPGGSGGSQRSEDEGEQVEIEALARDESPLPSQALTEGTKKATINDAALESAIREGKDDPNEASINVKDEEFFASEYQEEAFTDSYTEGQRQPSKAKWVSIAVVVIVMAVGGYGIYYLSTSPYVGDGPPELQVDRSTLAKKQGPKSKTTNVAILRSKDAQLLVEKSDSQAHMVAVGKPDASMRRTTEPDSGSASPGKAPGEYEALLTEGLALLKTRKKRKAQKVLNKAVEVNPQGWQALQQLALIQMEAGRMPAAHKLAKSAESANPKAPFAQLVIGSVLQEQGRKAAAKKAYEIFILECPKCRYADDIKAILKGMK